MKLKRSKRCRRRGLEASILLLDKNKALNQPNSFAKILYFMNMKTATRMAASLMVSTVNVGAGHIRNTINEE